MQSFLPVAADSDFPLQNLPYGVFSPLRPADGFAAPRCGTAVGDYVVDLSVLQQAGLLPLGPAAPAFRQPSLNDFAALPRPIQREVREALTALLRADNPRLRDDASLRRRALFPRQQVRMHLPMAIGDYTDFYSSRQHAANVGAMFRGPDQALQPNWLHLPVAYHGRSSSIVVDGADIVRPHGQLPPVADAPPRFGPTSALDFELEVGALIGQGSSMGRAIPIQEAESHVFGLVLVNDWSARDIQRWEYVPLGPFLGKNFATSISPWVVTLDALEPFRCQGPAQDPAPLAYLRSPGPAAFDIQLQVELTPAGQPPQVIAAGNFRTLYWSLRQQVAHHACNGCPLRPGDLLASGTISGDAPGQWGSLLEITRNGAEPIPLASGPRRGYLQDGDRVTIRGWAQGDGYRVGFGQVSGRITAANAGEAP